LKSKDLFGKALQDYFNHLNSKDDLNKIQNLITSTNISDDDELPLSYLFREFKDMPKIEQHALNLCHGKILDVGCGAGSHSLWLQDKGFKIKAIDVSQGAVNVSKLRGVINVEHIALLKEKRCFDSILLLMNGTGIFKEFRMVESYLKHLKTLLNPDGQILIDSSDISYMYDGEEQNNLKSDRYYGELDYFIKYKEDYELPMTWLYLDFESLHQACQTLDLKCEMIFKGEHFDYLARISFE
jgi:SAM-dependent methyltransferase